MPLIKRRNVPATKIKRASYLPTRDGSSPGPSIESLIRRYDRLAEEAAWDGNTNEADAHQAKADEYRERSKNGELWEINH